MFFESSIAGLDAVRSAGVPAAPGLHQSYSDVV